eukprot:scaffold30857_cov23-Tisochrysis_lutea.AAC.1
MQGDLINGHQAMLTRDHEDAKARSCVFIILIDAAHACSRLPQTAIPHTLYRTGHTHTNMLD